MGAAGWYTSVSIKERGKEKPSIKISFFSRCPFHNGYYTFSTQKFKLQNYRRQWRRGKIFFAKLTYIISHVCCCLCMRSHKHSLLTHNITHTQLYIIAFTFEHVFSQLLSIFLVLQIKLY